MRLPPCFGPPSDVLPGSVPVHSVFVSRSHVDPSNGHQPRPLLIVPPQAAITVTTMNRSYWRSQNWVCTLRGVGRRVLGVVPVGYGGRGKCRFLGVISVSIFHRSTPNHDSETD